MPTLYTDPDVQPNGQVHPLAAAIPMLDPMDEQMVALGRDIRDNGLIHPLTVGPDGTLLDGRHRELICKTLGIEPRYVVHTGDPVVFIASTNLKRRHFDEQERIRYALEIKRALDARADKPKGGRPSAADQGEKPTLVSGEVSGDRHSRESSAQAARLAGVSRYQVEKAEQLAKIEARAPDLADQVRRNFRSIASAEHILERRAAGLPDTEPIERKKRRTATKKPKAPKPGGLRHPQCPSCECWV